MNAHFSVPQDTIERQRRASDPNHSAFVSANAGAGKTKVLTDRVVRLLLAGSPPGRILCLTFTKAAAATMAIRIFERLGRWVTLDDAALATELRELEGREPRPEELALARRLFARAVETPGGLKIDTLHAFCERLLHLVPFEANVPARFAVLDEARSGELVAEQTATVLALAASGRRPDLESAYRLVSLEAIGDGLLGAIDAALRARATLRAVAADGIETYRRKLAGALGLRDGETSDGVKQALLGLLSTEDARSFEALLRRSGPKDQGVADLLLASLQSADLDGRTESLRLIALTAKGEPRDPDKIVTKGMPEALRERLAAWQADWIALEDRLKAATALERTLALFTLAAEISRGIEATKARLGALDFADLIERTLALLRSEAASWVLYKLDRGIDHVLVDEAQDTNPDQWEILRLITADFSAGHGARSRRRTVFAVGDPKQSIYGFQGAEPEAFEESRRWWKNRLNAAELSFEEVRLKLSFRSAGTVLAAVDATFAIESHGRGLLFGDTGAAVEHETARPRAPGRVELWPVETPQEDAEPDPWTAPVDQAPAGSPPVVVAQRIAAAVRRWTTAGDETGRRWRAGEILILVRQRGPAFEAVIRALKQEGVPVAGQDRLKVGEHIAVMDLMAAGRAALRPEDDLTLAAALKSPLVGLTDDDLIRIAARRPDAETLASALACHAAAGDEAATRGHESLLAWRRLAQAKGPFGFYATLLGPMQGRRRLVGRLGQEAGDAIDAFLCMAHTAELAETPALGSFLLAFEAAPHEIKRDLDAARDEVRVMTVHGAKGLEADLVVLIDGCHVLGPDPLLVPLGRDRLPIWAPSKKGDSDRLRSARDALHQKGLEEHNRLLYVAMTRAKDRLVIVPYRTSGKETPSEAWCEMVRLAFAARTGAIIRESQPFGDVQCWADDLPITPAEPMPTELGTIETPPWLHRPVAGGASEPFVTPSTAGVAGSHGAWSEEARLRGVLLHELLEGLPALPAPRREATARAMLAAKGPALPEATRERLAADALAVIAMPELAPLFGPGARAEAPVAGWLCPDGVERLVVGRVDRLAVGPDRVIVADFKTGRPPGAEEPPPEGHRTQLALYRDLLREAFPDRPVAAVLVYTAGPVVRWLEDEPAPGAGLVTAG